MRHLIWISFFFKINASRVVRSLFYFVGVSNHRLLEWFSSYLHTSLSAFRSGMGNLFTIAGHINCGISLAGRTINFNCILKFCLYLPNLQKENTDLFWLTVYLSWSFVLTRCYVLIWLTKILMRTILNVYVGRRFPTPASGETNPVSCFNLMTRLTVARLTPTTAEISVRLSCVFVHSYDLRTFPGCRVHFDRRLTCEYFTADSRYKVYHIWCNIGWRNASISKLIKH